MQAFLPGPPLTLVISLGADTVAGEPAKAAPAAAEPRPSTSSSRAAEPTVRSHEAKRAARAALSRGLKRQSTTTTPSLPARILPDDVPATRPWTPFPGPGPPQAQ